MKTADGLEYLLMALEIIQVIIIYNYSFTEDGVYKIDMNPADRANNKGVFDVRILPSHTAIFEADFTALLCKREIMIW